jgi:hypothetical protein
MQFRLVAPAGQTPVLAVSGFGAHRALAAEAGLHVLETPGEETKRFTARVRVVEEPAADTPALYAKLLHALGEAPAGRAVIRRYRDGDSPLVRDSASGKRSGQLDRVLKGDFDLIFDPTPA